MDPALRWQERPGPRQPGPQWNGSMIAVGDGTGRPVRIEHLPLAEDPSHAGVFGYASDDFEAAVELAALVGRRDVYPAVT